MLANIVMMLHSYLGRGALIAKGGHDDGAGERFILKRR